MNSKVIVTFLLFFNKHLKNFSNKKSFLGFFKTSTIKLFLEFSLKQSKILRDMAL